MNKTSLLLACAVASSGAAELTLSQALREALEHNPGYQASRNDVHYADAARDSAVAGYLPTVTATGAYGKSWLDTHKEAVGGAIQNQNGVQTTTRTAGVNMDWILFQGFSAPLNQKRARLQLDIANASEGVSREDLVRDVVLAYADLARQIRFYRAFDTSASISEERMRILERSLAVGAVSRSDWLSARVDRNADEAALKRSEASLQSARILLGQVLGRDKAVSEEVDSVALSSAPLELESLLRDLPEHRPDLRIAETNVALAEVAARQRATNWLPRLDALAGYNYSLMNAGSTIPNSLIQSRTLGPSIGAQLNFNLFTGEFPWQTYHRARIALTSVELRKQQALSAAAAEVTKDHAVFRGADSALTLEREALGYAQENLGLTFTRWKSGSLSYVDARHAQDQYLTAFVVAENTEFDALIAHLELLRAAGRMESLIDSTSSR